MELGGVAGIGPVELKTTQVVQILRLPAPVVAEPGLGSRQVCERQPVVTCSVGKATQVGQHHSLAGPMIQSAEDDLGAAVVTVGRFIVAEVEMHATDIVQGPGLSEPVAVLRRQQRSLGASVQGTDALSGDGLRTPHIEKSDHLAGAVAELT